MKEINESSQQSSTGFRKFDVARTSAPAGFELPLPNTKEGEALRQAIDRYNKGEKGEVSDFSRDDAKTLVKEIRNAEITSNDIDNAVKIKIMAQPNTSDTDLAKKLLLNLSTDIENIEGNAMKDYKDINQDIVDEGWKKIESNLPKSPALQKALEHIFKEKTGNSFKQQDYSIEEEIHMDISQITEIDESKIKYLPKHITDLLSEAINSSRANLSSSKINDKNKESHMNLILNAEEILLNNTDYPQGSKSLIRSTRNRKNIIFSVSSMTEALENLRQCLNKIKNRHLTSALTKIIDYCRKS